MSLPARSAPDTRQSCRSSLFVGRHVRLDEARWSQSFEEQVSSWATSTTMLIVLESGQAMLSVRDDGWPVMIAGQPRLGELCAVFRFESGAAASTDVGAVFSPIGTQRLARPLVQLSPRALLRFYWRRHALKLGYPSPSEHVEEDAMALLQHVSSRVRSEACRMLGIASEGRLRHRALSCNARALMALSIADPHPIVQVARALDTSPFHLAHVFRTEVGISPHKYLMQLRLVAALVQLRHGPGDLSRLALDLGFCHHSHFTAVFRQALGYTPREVRRMLTAECIADLGIAARCS